MDSGVTPAVSNADSAARAMPLSDKGRSFVGCCCSRGHELLETVNVNVPRIVIVACIPRQLTDLDHHNHARCSQHHGSRRISRRTLMQPALPEPGRVGGRMGLRRHWLEQIPSCISGLIKRLSPSEQMLLRCPLLTSRYHRIPGSAQLYAIPAEPRAFRSHGPCLTAAEPECIIARTLPLVVGQNTYDLARRCREFGD